MQYFLNTHTQNWRNIFSIEIKKFRASQTCKKAKKFKFIRNFGPEHSLPPVPGTGGSERSRQEIVEM